MVPSSRKPHGMEAAFIVFYMAVNNNGGGSIIIFCKVEGHAQWTLNKYSIIWIYSSAAKEKSEWHILCNNDVEYIYPNAMYVCTCHFLWKREQKETITKLMEC